MQPNMKAMTAQIHAGILDQTRQLGSFMDVQNTNKVARDLQEIELQSRKDMQPNEKTCAAGTPLMALGNTMRASANITKSFVYTSQARSAGIRLKGDVERLERLAQAEAEKNGSSLFKDAAAAADISPILTPAADQKERIKTYCKYFRDPEANTGVGLGELCNENVSNAARSIPDGDIDIENFLLKDTIDLSKPEEQAAATAIVTNLLEPQIRERLPDGGTNTGGALETQPGRQSTIQRENIAAIRNIARSVVSSMIARRTSIPGTDQTFNVTVTKPDPNAAGKSVSAEADGMGADAESSPTGTASTAPGCQTAASIATHAAPRHNLVYGTAQPLARPADGAPCGDYNRFIYTLGKAEGGGSYSALNSLGYMGKYQFGELALTDLGYCTRDKMPGQKCTIWTPKSQKRGVSTFQHFLSNGPFQELVMKEHLASGYRYQRTLGLEKYLGKTVNGVFITGSGMLAASHLAGPGGLKCFLTRNVGYCKYLAGKGQIKLDSNYIPMDGNSVRASAYLNLFNGFTTPFSPAWPAPGEVVTTSPMLNDAAGDTGTPTASKTEVVAVNINTEIKDIRSKAGVSDYDISANPSYNEIMVAMTKERFFDPAYYATLANDEGALLQEQTVVNSYIAIQLQDIYRLQEQVNMLLAARAAMQLNAMPFSDLSNQQPVTGDIRDMQEQMQMLAAMKPLPAASLTAK